MASNSISILITGKDQFSPKAQKAQRSAKGLSGTMKGLGKTALAVGTGFIAAQASIAGVQRIMTQSIGAALKYEGQMAQIRALTGATKEDTDFLQGAIKEMVREMPKSASELGAAAYFILSSGIEDAADAAEVLEIAAKASTIGLGETERVADALTTVLNAYGLEAGDAAHVTDVMIEAVKQGKAEADAFAGVLGRVVPLASQMGISFEEVAANLATFTRLGVSAEEAATGLRAVMNALINPTNQTRETMEELGLSVEGLRKQIKEKGLLAALNSMMTATGGNEEALAKLFPNIRALTSVLGTAGVQMEDYTNILAATENATGNLEEGFAIVADTAEFKLNRAMGNLNFALMELGAETLPAIAEGAEGATVAIQAMSDAISETVTVAKIANDGLGFLGVGVEDVAFKVPGLAQALKMPGVIDEVKSVGQTFGIFGKDAREELFDTGLASERMAARFKETADAIDVAFRERIQVALDQVTQSAEEAREALAGMFRVVTQEEAAASSALADYRLEAGRLEAKTGDLTAAESARLDQLTGEIIPASEDALGLIRLETDAVAKDAQVKTNAGPSLAAWTSNIQGGVDAVVDLDRKLRGLPSLIESIVRVSFRGFDISAGERALLSGALLPSRQHGGPVSAGQAVLVGERRPEIFVPDRAGTILPDANMGGGLTININGVFAGDERTAMELANMIAPEIRRMMN
jgi:TP901 family phage tail tape measure protein